MPQKIDSKSISVLQLKNFNFNVAKIQPACKKWACDRLYPELVFR